MGFFKELGQIAGTIAGGVLGGGTYLIGELLDNDFIKEVGESAYQATENTGKTIGQAADGAFSVVAGIIAEDEMMIDKGLEEIGEIATTTVSGFAQGATHLIENGAGVIDGLANGDTDKAFESGRNLAKIAATSVIAIGVFEALDVFDGLDDIDGVDDVAYIDLEEAEIHDVEPHYVEGHMREGTYIEGYWRDGDGNTDVDLSSENGGGYIRTNPDGIINNNLG